MSSDPFSDARQQLGHTTIRIREFGVQGGAAWTVSVEPIQNGEARYSLQLHNERVRNLKVLIGEVANGLRHTLDLLMSAAAKLSLGDSEADRVRKRISFPFPDEGGAIDKDLAGQSQYISGGYGSAIADVFARHSRYHYYVWVLRQISNNSKHWGLEVVIPDARAVQLRASGGGAQIFQIPQNHFAVDQVFEWEGSHSPYVEFITSLQFAGFPARPPEYPMPPCPDTVFRTCQQYVGDMIEAFTKV